MKHFNNLLKTALFAAVFVLSGTTARAQVTVTATAGVLGPVSYTTLNAAFIDINAGLPQGAITVAISANTTEAGPCVLNSSGAGPAIYTSVVIRPTVDGVSISGATPTGRGLIELKGADNVTIDGDNLNTGGINRNLSIINTAVNTTTFTSCIRIANAATVVSSDNITVQNCIITGSATGRNLAAATSTTGSENTTYGIYAGGNGGATSTDAPTALTSVTTNTAPTATTVNAFLANNNEITSCARAIAFNGANAAVSTGVTITNNVIGTSGVLSGAPPFTAPASTVYTKGIWVNGTTAITVTGNTLNNILSYVATPMSGVELVGSIGAGTINISNNTITGICNNAATPNAVRAIGIFNAGAPYTISNNTITNIQGILSGISTLTTVAGIDANTTAASGTIELNKINLVYNRNAGTTGAFGIHVLGGNSVTIRNNFISDVNINMTGGFAFEPIYNATGIRIATGTGHRIYYNSIYLTGSLLGTATASMLTSCLAIASTTSTGMDIRNNILANTMTGGTTQIAHVSLYLPSGATSSMNLTLNNNVYYCGTNTASQGIGQAGLTPATNFYLPGNFNPLAVTPATNMRSYTSTLSAAGTNDNLSSASNITPPFVSLTDLHINLAAPNFNDVDAKAAVIAGITLDIDGNTRNATTPDIGGDEFINPLCTGASGGTISPTSYTFCAGQTVTMTSVGATTGTGITYQWMVGTTSGGPYVNVTGGSGATTVAYTTGVLSAGTFYYVLQTTCSNGPLTGLSNEVTVTVNALPTVNVTPNTMTYCDGTPSFALTASGASTYTWGPAAGLSATTGSTVNATPLSTVTYTVTGTNANGCVDTATAAITWAPAVTGVVASSSPSAVCIGDSIDLASTVTDPITLISQNFTSLGSWTVTSDPTTPPVTNWASVASPFSYVAGSLNFANFSTPNGGNFYMTNSDAGGSGSTTNTQLVSPVFSTMGMTTASLTFEQLYQRWASGDVTVAVEISTDGGTTWSTLQAFTSDQGVITAGAQVATTTTINLSAYLNQSNLRLRYNYIAVWGYYWILDNIVVSGNMNNTFAWTSIPIGFSSTLQSPQNIVPTATADYHVVVTNAMGCTSAPSTVNVVVNALPTVVANATATTVCSGSPVTLTGSGATSYTWAAAMTVTDNVAFNPTATDTYTVTGTDGNGCTDTDMITVTINPLPTVVANATATTICDGDPVTLTGSGATSYTWAAAMTVTDNVAFNPTATDTYTVTGTDGNGCENTDMITVTVNPLPTVVANSTATAVCDGSPVTLTGSGAASYTWAATMTVTDNVAFTPTATDTYTVTGTDVNGCENTDMITVTVNTLPTVVANSTATTVCSGSSVTLTGSGAISYTWAAAISVTDNVAFNPTATDTYTVTGTDGNGCTDTDMITVTVNALPTVVANSTATAVCDGSPVTLTGSGATSYTWAATMTVTDNVAFTPTATDTYTVTGTDGNGCTNTDMITVTVNALPTVTAVIPQSSVCVDDGNLTLTGGSPAAGTWSGTNVAAGIFNPTTVGSVTITYTYTDGNGCTNSATDNISVDACTGIITVGAVAEVTVYPNPNEGQFTIQLPAVPTSSVQVEVMNELGQVVDAFTMTGTTKEVNISTLEGGVYFVRVINEGNVSVHRVVKQ